MQGDHDHDIIIINVPLQAAAKIVSSSGVPHFINATNPRGRDIVWNTPDHLDSSFWSFSNWDEKSGQPNDCIVEETCVFIGPHGKVNNNGFKILDLSLFPQYQSAEESTSQTSEMSH